MSTGIYMIMIILYQLSIMIMIIDILILILMLLLKDFEVLLTSIVIVTRTTYTGTTWKPGLTAR